VTRIIDDFERDDAVRVIVVSGAGGRAFASGADISEFNEKRASEAAAADLPRSRKARGGASRRP
jgi:enoyl-CoA hydratase/carnithine racemase